MALWPIGSLAGNLKFEDISIFSVSRTRAIEGLAILDGVVHYTAPKRGNLYSAVIDHQAPYPDLVVRGVKEPDFSADRWEYGKHTKSSAITALARYPKWPAGLMMIDGRRMQLRFVELTKPIEWAWSDLIVDKIRPAADSRGEAPWAETATARRQFVRGVKKLMNKRQTVVTGSSLYSQQGRLAHFLATTAVPGFGLVMLSCQLDNFYYCKIDRACMLPAALESPSRPLVGVAYHKKGRTVVVADRHAAYQLKMHSCYDLRLTKKLVPPRQIHKLTGVAIDAKRRLWLATEGLDNYHAANIYAWPARSW